jgi:hypothetical protein
MSRETPIRASVGAADSISLSVSRHEFSALKDRLSPALRPIKNERASLSFANGRLGIKSAEMSVTIAASGNWLGTAHVPLSFMLLAVRNPAAQDPVLLIARDGRLHIGNSSVTCQWHPQRALGRAKVPPLILASV